jgi:hypothetical protein
VLGQVAKGGNRRPSWTWAAIFVATSLVGGQLAVAKECAPGVPAHGAAADATWGRTVRHKELDFSFTVPPGFRGLPYEGLAPNILHVYGAWNWASCQPPMLLIVDKMPCAVNVATLATSKPAMIANIKTILNDEVDPDLEPCVELFLSEWKTLPVVCYRGIFRQDGRWWCVHSARLPIKPHSIVFRGYAAVEHEEQLRLALQTILASVEGEPTAWVSQERPWTWAERGGEISKAASWIVMSEAVVLLLWRYVRKRRRRATVASPPQIWLDP